MAALALATTSKRTFTEGVHYRMVQHESGSERHDLPIWASSPEAVKFGDEWGPVKRFDVEGVPGAFVLSHVLTEDECTSIAELSEAMGYTEDAPVSLGRRIRRNENCVLIADDSLWLPIWERVRQHMPMEVGRRPCGLNQRWRLYRYGQDDIFRMHTDGSWPGSGLDGSGVLVRDLFGDRWSTMVRDHVSRASSCRGSCYSLSDDGARPASPSLKRLATDSRAGRPFSSTSTATMTEARYTRTCTLLGAMTAGAVASPAKDLLRIPRCEIVSPRARICSKRRSAPLSPPILAADHLLRPVWHRIGGEWRARERLDPSRKRPLLLSRRACPLPAT